MSRTISDDYLRESMRNSRYLYRFLKAIMKNKIIKMDEKKSAESIDYLIKKHPERVKNTDIQKKYIEEFMQIAQERGLKCYAIKESQYSDNMTLKYSNRDEHEIAEIFKLMQEKHSKELELSRELDFNSREETSEKREFEILKRELDPLLEEAKKKNIELEVVEENNKFAVIKYDVKDRGELAKILNHEIRDKDEGKYYLEEIKESNELVEKDIEKNIDTESKESSQNIEEAEKAPVELNEPVQEIERER